MILFEKRKLVRNNYFRNKICLLSCDKMQKFIFFTHLAVYYLIESVKLIESLSHRKIPVCGDLRFVLSHVLGTRELLRLKIRKIQRV